MIYNILEFAKNIIKFCIIFLLIFYIIINNEANSDTTVEGCKNPSLKYNIKIHEGIFQDVYELYDDSKRFIILVDKVKIGENKYETPHIDMIQCDYKSKIKSKEQLGKL